MTVGGVSYNRVSVASGAESWAWLPPAREIWIVEYDAGGVEQHAVAQSILFEYERGNYNVPVPEGFRVRKEDKQRHKCQVVAHAHISDNIKQKKRDVAWCNVLGEMPLDTPIYGAGWEHWSRYPNGNFKGVVKPDEALRLFNETQFTPCVAAAPGFYTGKPYVAFSQGCVPLFYGDGTDPYTWDPQGTLVPLDDPRRIVKPGDLWRLLGELDYETELSYWADRLKPRWQMLDQLVDYLLAGRELGETFGGYFRC